MRNRFDQQLADLNPHLLEMGAMIEKSIENAIFRIKRKLRSLLSTS